MAAVEVRSAPVDSNVALLDHVIDERSLVWIRGGDGVVGHGEAARIDAGVGPDRFTRAAAELDSVWRSLEHDGIDPHRLVAFASFTFDARSPGSGVVVPSHTVARRAGEAWRTDIGPITTPAPQPVTVLQGPRDRIRYAGSSLPDVLWLERVAQVIERIEAGELDKVVLARDHAVWSRTPFDLPLIVRRLAAAYPACFTFSCDGLVGATPELLIGRRGPVVRSIVLAGSTARDLDRHADRELGERLLGSKKDQHEHELSVASVRDVLAGVCAELEVDTEPSLLRLANVQHLATVVTGRLRDDRALPTALELAALLHPTAAIGGAPTEAAVETIRALEGMDRRRYGGPVGWVDASGDGAFGIALRCAEISGARARLFAGAGVVAGSLPEAELEETRLKLRAMQAALDDAARSGLPAA